jgi:hypothetical protein
MKYPLFIAGSAAILLGGCSTIRGENMAMDSRMPAGSMVMSAADMNMMMSCKRMSMNDMMKNERCAKMMKMHPGMMNMSMMDMEKMSSCMKMSKAAMMADSKCVSMMEMHRMKTM